MANLSLFFQMDLAVQIHLIAALEAVALTPFVIFRRRRDRLHKVLGYIWVTNMMVAAISSMFIHGIRVFGPFSYIHLLSVFTMVAVPLAVRSAIRGDLRAHEGAMRNTAFWGLGVAGMLSFLPGRLMNRMIFGENELLGISTAAAIFAALYLWGRLAGRRPARRRPARGTRAA